MLFVVLIKNLMSKMHVQEFAGRAINARASAGLLKGCRGAYANPFAGSPS